jgi:hypothetical protein
MKKGQLTPASRDSLLLRARRQNSKGLLLGAALSGLLGAFLLAFVPWGAQQRIYGRVVGVSHFVTNGRRGSGVVTQLSVRTREGATVAVFGGRSCLVGDRVELNKGRSAFGPTYSVAIRGCGR